MKKKRLAALFMAAASALSMSMVSPAAFADDGAPGDSGNDASIGGTGGEGGSTDTGFYAMDTSTASKTSFTFNKYLIMDKNVNVPAVVFNFEIAPDKAVNEKECADGLFLYKGVGAPSVSDQAEFDAGKSTNTEPYNTHDNKNSPVSIDVLVTSDVNKKYAVDEVTVDFGGVTFDEPGVYRYKVSETLDDDGTYTCRTAKVKTLDVYVDDCTTDPAAPTLRIGGYVMYDKLLANSEEPKNGDPLGYNKDGDLVEEPAPEDAQGLKSTGFINEMHGFDLTFGKEVTGNQGSKDKYFKFLLSIENAMPNHTYHVCVNGNISGVIGNADATVEENNATNSNYLGKTNDVTITTDADGKVTEKEYYLHDGQYITVCGLEKGVKYTVTEPDPEGYVSVAGIKDTDSSMERDSSHEGFDEFKDPTTGTISSASVYTGFTNSRTGTIPTGILLSVAAPAGIGLCVLGGIIFLAVKRSRKDEDEEE